MVMLSAVVVLPTLPFVSAVFSNRPVDGFAQSGRFWPKTIIWGAIRHPPGIYWLVYVIFACATPNAIGQSLLNVGFIFPKGYISIVVTGALGYGLVLIGIGANMLADVVQSYLIGMCMIQVLVDMLRSEFNKSESIWVSYMVIECFQGTSVLAIALLDSYRPLNQLNCAYSVGAVFIAVVMAIVSTKHLKYGNSLGLAGGSLQMIFCIAAYIIALQVEGTNNSQMLAFLLTAACGFVLVSLKNCMGSRFPIITYETDGLTVSVGGWTVSVGGWTRSVGI